MSEAGARKKPLGNLVVRLATGLTVAPLIIVLLMLGPAWGWEIVVWVGVLLGSLELARMTLGESPAPQILHAVLTVIAVAAATHGGEHPSVVVGAVFAVILSAMLAGLRFVDPIESAATRTGWLIAGPLYLGIPLSTLILLRRLDGGGGWVLLSLMLAWLADTAAYFAGRGFGRRKLYEKVSPKKTVEGAVGGLFGSTGGALLAHFWYLPELSLVGAIGLGLVAGGLGQAGDLAESMIKRSTGVKDSGRIIPGHGGILDRIDALIFAAPVTWAYATWLHPLLR